MERRDFIKSAGASAVTAGATLNASGQAQSPARIGNPVSRPMSPVIRYGLRSHYRTIAFPGGSVRNAG
jgi:hypothetical protein